MVIGKGTENFRAPEIKKWVVKDTKAADVFSLGILLYVLATH